MKNSFTVRYLRAIERYTGLYEEAVSILKIPLPIGEGYDGVRTVKRQGWKSLAKEMKSAVDDLFYYELIIVGLPKWLAGISWGGARMLGWILI